MITRWNLQITKLYKTAQQFILDTTYLVRKYRSSFQALLDNLSSDEFSDEEKKGRKSKKSKNARDLSGKDGDVSSMFAAADKVRVNLGYLATQTSPPPPPALHKTINLTLIPLGCKMIDAKLILHDFWRCALSHYYKGVTLHYYNNWAELWYIWWTRFIFKHSLRICWKTLVPLEVAAMMCGEKEPAISSFSGNNKKWCRAETGSTRNPGKTKDDETETTKENGDAEWKKEDKRLLM